MNNIRNQDAPTGKIVVLGKVEKLFISPFDFCRKTLKHKHNSMTSRKPLHIEIRNTGDYIEVKNNIQPKLGNEAPSGYGLNLLKKRYESMKLSKVIFSPLLFK